MERSEPTNSTRGREILLSIASVAALLALLLAALQIGVCWLDLPDPDFRYDNQLAMWRPDPLLGFANRPDFRDFAFGDVAIETNERGFRGTLPTPTFPPAGTHRIVGIGDSVMWGTGVDARHSVPGLVAQRLEAVAAYDVVNAAVIGYSSLQEQLQLERDVLPLHPEVVLVNLCSNDLLPSEDPFGNVRELYLRDLAALDDEVALTREQQAIRRRLEDLLRDPRSVWRGLAKLERQMPGVRDQTVKWWIERPFARMAAQARRAGVRLIVLLIPTRSGGERYFRIAENVKRVLRDNGAEYIDLQTALPPESDEAVRSPTAPRGSGWRPAQLDQISRWLHFRRLHASRNYIDTFHLSRRGSAVVADAVARAVARGASPAETR